MITTIKDLTSADKGSLHAGLFHVAALRMACVTDDTRIRETVPTLKAGRLKRAAGGWGTGWPNLGGQKSGPEAETFRAARRKELKNCWAVRFRLCLESSGRAV